MSITRPAGFLAAGVAAGLKAAGRRDVALVVNQGPSATAAVVTTTNRFAAAPVLWTRKAAGDGRLRAVVANSGGANACTGQAGYSDAVQTADFVAETLGVELEEVGVLSTGLIGVRLPMDALTRGIAAAADALSDEGGAQAAEAIMTTDTVTKQGEVEGDGWCIGGMAKGAGMLAPQLATMLVVLTTDADLTPEQADAALRHATSRTFDRTDADGCMSTNDTVVLMASGASGRTPEPDAFAAALEQVCADLARQLLTDAEGAEHDIAITVTGAASEQDALEAARAVARSNLFKCAIFGNDPNWGRVLASVGTTDAAFDPHDVSVTFNGVTVFRRGALGDDRSKVSLAGSRDVLVEVDLGAGAASATVWTNDLTYGYVKENAEYSS